MRAPGLAPGESPSQHAQPHARTPPRGTWRDRGQKRPRGGAQAGRGTDTHLAVFANPPATQGNSSGSARAQRGRIFARGLPPPPPAAPPEPPVGRARVPGRCGPAASALLGRSGPPLLPGAVAAGGGGALARRAAAPLPVRRGPARAGRAGRAAHIWLGPASSTTRASSSARALCSPEKRPPDAVRFTLVRVTTSRHLFQTAVSRQVSVIPALGFQNLVKSKREPRTLVQNTSIPLLFRFSSYSARCSSTNCKSRAATAGRSPSPGQPHLTSDLPCSCATAYSHGTTGRYCNIVTSAETSGRNTTGPSSTPSLHPYPSVSSLFLGTWL